MIHPGTANTKKNQFNSIRYCSN